MQTNSLRFQQQPDTTDYSVLFPGYLILLEAAARRRKRLAMQADTPEQIPTAENPQTGGQNGDK